MIHDRIGHPYGVRATMDAIIAFTILIFAIGKGIQPTLHLAGLIKLLAARFTVLDAILAFTFLFCWRYCFSLLGVYRPGCLSRLSRTVLAVKGCVIMTVVLDVLLLAKGAPALLPISRIFLLTTLSYVSLRILVGGSLRRLIVGANPCRAIILGSGRRAGKAWRAVRTHNHKEVLFLGFVDTRSTAEMAPDIADRYLGSIDQLSELLLSEVVDTMIVALPAKSCYGLIQSAIDAAEQIGVSVVYLDDVFSTSHRPRKGQVEDPFVRLDPLQATFIFRHRAKRAIDIAGAVIMLILAAPLMAVISLLIKATSSGKVFYIQERFGYKRRRFQMVKFRSMVKDADLLMAALESQNESTGPSFKLRNDPRITPLGKVLRATSLDELPQLWNVLRGEMSLVGPRPMSVRDVTLFRDVALMRRFSVKPGMTGLWQVSGRSDLSFDQWMTYDFHYIDRWSLTLDLQILLRTFSAVARRSGAM